MGTTVADTRRRRVRRADPHARRLGCRWWSHHRTGAERGEGVTELSGVPPLRDPVMVAAFEGWNDAGEAASGAVAHLERVWGAEAVGELDPEEYHDFQVNRPTISVDDNGKRQITWPTTRLFWARPPGSSRDVVIVRGIEPSMRWQRFTREILQYAEQLKVGTIITLGALLADVPHTRPIPVTSTT